MDTEINFVMRDENGKVQRVACGQDPLEATEFERVEIVDQIYFRPVGHDGGKPYRMDDLRRSLEPVRSICYNDNAGNAAKVVTEGRCST